MYFVCIHKNKFFGLKSNIKGVKDTHTHRQEMFLCFPDDDDENFTFSFIVYVSYTYIHTYRDTKKKRN